MGNKCSPLGCENCSGCKLSALELYYRGRLILNNYLSEEEQNYIFVGEINPEELANKSLHKNYIFLQENKLKVFSFKDKLKSYIPNSLDKFFVDEFIPKDIINPDKLTKLGINELYGIEFGIPKRYFIKGEMFEYEILKEIRSI